MHAAMTMGLPNEASAEATCNSPLWSMMYNGPPNRIIKLERASTLFRCCFVTLDTALLCCKPVWLAQGETCRCRSQLIWPQLQTGCPVLLHAILLQYIKTTNTSRYSHQTPSTAQPLGIGMDRPSPQGHLLLESRSIFPVRQRPLRFPASARRAFVSAGSYDLHTPAGIELVSTSC